MGATGGARTAGAAKLQTDSIDVTFLREQLAAMELEVASLRQTLSNSRPRDTPSSPQQEADTPPTANADTRGAGATSTSDAAAQYAGRLTHTMLEGPSAQDGTVGKPTSNTDPTPARVVVALHSWDGEGTSGEDGGYLLFEEGARIQVVFEGEGDDWWQVGHWLPSPLASTHATT